LLALFVFSSLATFEVLLPVASAFQHLGQVITSATRVGQLINQKPEVTFPINGAAQTSKVVLQVTGLSFTYPQQPLPVLQNISLSLAAGEHIALLGRTGCGKSTFLQLLTRAWDTTQGIITLNGEPLENYDETTLRQMMTMISQRVHIFSSTLRENLLLACSTASDAQLKAVLEQVGLANLLDNSEGLNAWMGDGGRPLSGGEQRRVGIARALLHPAPLLLLDEPTEGLDAGTEQQILALIRQHFQYKSLIIVTHRLHGLEYMDRICVMDGGKIIEQGNHQTLLQNKGRYYQFHQRH
jgi:ATP-binding cassette subfamily C protein CydC